MEGELGRGGTATVHRVRHTALGTVHALKVLHHDSLVVRRRLLTEGRVQARLQHRNIVAVTDVIALRDGVGLVMELVRGPSLAELIADTRLDHAQLDALAEGLFRGIGFAHDQGYVHRDIKPSNVLCQIEGHDLVPKLADFGLVKGGAMANLTRTGVAMGTPRYMAPEQIRDAKAVDLRADLFALGAVLYALVTGQDAFSPEEDDMLSAFNAVVAGQRIPVEVLRPDTPARMCRAIEAALQTDPDDRPRSATELATIWRGREAPLRLFGDLVDSLSPTPRTDDAQPTLQPTPPEPSEPPAPTPPRSVQRVAWPTSVETPTPVPQRHPLLLPGVVLALVGLLALWVLATA